MKKLIAIVMVLLCASLMFAKEETEKHETGTNISYEFQSGLSIRKQNIFKEYYYEHPTRIYSILPYNDGYLLKLSFDELSYSGPVLELFVKTGMVFETGNPKCPKIKIAGVRPNEIELTYILPD